MRRDLKQPDRTPAADPWNPPELAGKSRGQIHEYFEQLGYANLRCVVRRRFGGRWLTFRRPFRHQSLDETRVHDCVDVFNAATIA
jgi:hypothetical protein